MLELGASVPSVSADNQDGATIEPNFSTPTVIYFYPKDDSPGCSVETQQFDEAFEEYLEEDIDVFGVSTDSVESHRQFHSKYDLDFDLLADPDGQIAAAFGVSIAGGRADRVTFVIDDGVIQHRYTGVDPDGHAKDVLDTLLDDRSHTFD
jgi:peroxiredoxin Q/BCP